MDWNWFFSSLAQSAAAIVGFFGAFIITKVVSNEATFQVKCNRLKDLIRESLLIRDEVSKINFTDYNKIKDQAALEKFKDWLDNNTVKNELDFDFFYRKSDFSLYSSRIKSIELLKAAFESHNIAKEKEREERRKAEDAKKNQASSSSFLDRLTGGASSSITSASVKLGPDHFANISDEMISGRIVQEIEEKKNNIKGHIRIVSDFLETIDGDPESTGLIANSLLVVIILFYAGVIYPLNFMPVATNATPIFTLGSLIPAGNLKGGLLFLVFLIFVSAVTFFFVKNNNLIYPKGDVENLKIYKDICSYSDFFSEYENNKNFKRELSKRELSKL